MASTSVRISCSETGIAAIKGLFCSVMGVRLDVDSTSYGGIMNRKSLLALFFVAAAAGCATDSRAPQVGPDGLVAVQSGRVDQLYLRPGGDIAGYRKVVLLDPVSVQMRDDWVKQQHGNNYRIQPTYPRYKEADQVARESADSVSASLAKAFRAAGFEIVETPGPGVLRVSAKVTDMFVNAPDIVSPGYPRSVVRDAGEANLSLEVRDAVDGRALARVSHHAIARETPRGNYASDPLNSFWMETVFQRWADNCVAEIGLAQRDAHAGLK